MTISIVGATSEVGRELAYLFAKEADELVLTARRIKRIEPFRKDLLLRQTIAKVQLLELDVAQPQAETMAELLAKTDLLIVVVGYLGDQEKAMTESSERQRIWTANYTGPAEVISQVAAAMQARGKGGIIGVSSVAGERGRQSNYYYGSAKAGFTAFLDGLRHRLFAQKIPVMTVLPGFMATAMTEHLDLPPRLTASPQRAAQLIHKAWHRRRHKIYLLPIWRYIMLLIRNIPEWLFLRTKL